MHAFRRLHPLAVMFDLSRRHRRKDSHLTRFDRAHRHAPAPFSGTADGHEIVPRHSLADAHGSHPEGERQRPPKPVLGILGAVAIRRTIGQVEDLDSICAKSWWHVRKWVVGSVAIEVWRRHKRWH